MEDLDLIGYCELHCTTERALFSAEHINRMYELAGRPKWMNPIPAKMFISMHENMEELCRLARQRLDTSQHSAVIIPFPVSPSIPNRDLP